MTRSLPLVRLFGIRVGVNYSWFLVLFVVIFVLWDSLSETLDASETTVYVVAVVAAGSFFASILLHELGHALAARREGIAVAGVDSFWEAARLSAAADASPAEVVVSLLVSMNLVLLLFNLVPAFPLDGGRIARAAAWKVTGDRHRATRFAARIGIAFGWTLIALGIALLAFGGGEAAFDAVWFMALGFLLAQG